MNKLVVKTVGALVAAGVYSGAMISPPVQAGQWVLQHYIAEGSRSTSDPDPAAPNPIPWPSPVLAANAPNGYGVSSSRSKAGQGANANFTVFANNSGSVGAVFHWVPAQGQTLESDPPPAYINLLVTSTASSFNSSSVSGSANIDVQAKLNNGVRSLDQTGLPRNNMVSLEDKKLLRLPAGAEEVTITRSLLADSKIISTSYSVAGYSGTTYNNADVNVGVNSVVKFKAQEDPRKVRLYRPGAIDEWVDNEGNTHGHSIYSAYTNSGGIHRNVWQHIHAVCEGFTPSAPATWQWNPQVVALA